MHVIRQYEFGGPEVLRYEQGRDLEPGPSKVIDGHKRLAAIP